MKKLVILMIGMLFIMVSCKKDDPVEPAPPVPRPEEVTEEITFDPCCGTMRIIQEPESDVHFKTPRLLLMEGKGKASPIGDYTVVYTAHLDIYGNILSIVDGRITCADNSEIYTMGKSIRPDPGNPDNTIYEFRITGGSHCFLHAKGWISMHGNLDFDQMTWTLSGEGEVIY